AHGKRLPNESREQATFRRAGHSRTRTVDPVAQTYPSFPIIPGPNASVEGIGNVNGVLPPDTNGHVGPNHYLQWVNLSFAVYSKGAATSPPTLIYGPVPGNTLWSGFG